MIPQIFLLPFLWVSIATTSPIILQKQPPGEALAPSVVEVRAEIVRQATEANFDVEIALSVADCESDFRYDAKNRNSTAKGIFQWLDGTWKWIGAKGHQFDYKENIAQFIKWYPRYPQWWSQCN